MNIGSFSASLNRVKQTNEKPDTEYPLIHITTLKNVQSLNQVTYVWHIDGPCSWTEQWT